MVYEPIDALKNDKIVKQKAVPKMTAGRTVLIELVQRYLKGLLDPMVLLLEMHNFLYFMQEAGESLQLKYQKPLYLQVNNRASRTFLDG